MRSGVPGVRFVSLRIGCRLHRVMVMAASNAQHTPQHCGRHGEPAGYQHYDGHGQAHQCLLFALLRAHTLCK